MKNKTTKFISKTLILFPFLFGLSILTDFTTGVENISWFFSVISGLAFASGIIFWNLFDYEKFNKMGLSDFLESSHSLVVDNTDEN